MRSIIQAVHNEDNAKSTCINDFKNLDYVNNGMAASFCGVLIDFLQHTVAIQIFNVFCGTWLVLFINAFGYLVVAHAVAKYFWTHKSEVSKYACVCLCLYIERNEGHSAHCMVTYGSVQPHV